MINFTVDILAVFIALRMTHIKANVKKLIAVGILGGICASAELFVKNVFLNVAIAVVFVTSITAICAWKNTFLRKIKFMLSFYISSFLIGGAVNFIYNLLDKYLDKLTTSGSGEVNRKAIIFSLIILLIIGVLRVFIMMFSETVNEKSVRIKIEIEDKILEVDALVDTGNLVKDPMNMNPVIFLKKRVAKTILSNEVMELSDLDNLTPDFRKRIRLVPVTKSGVTHVMTGVRVDSVSFSGSKRDEKIDATVVIDKEEGTYGGYYALAPYVAICNV